jgi:uncharacterized alpha-E superfamily protein
MISRVADHCFWFGRYLERAESTARLLQVTATLALDADLTPLQSWQPVIVTEGEQDRFVKLFGEEALANGETVQEYLTFNPEVSACLKRSIAAARENARSIRETVSLEAWESINELHLWMQSPAARQEFEDHRYGFYRHIRRETQLCMGLLRGTMLYDTPLNFIWLGVVLERTGQTARILDVHHHAVIHAPPGERAGVKAVVEESLWLSLLRACYGFEPFMKSHRGPVTGQAVAHFLVFESRFPRGIRHGLKRAREWLERIRPPGSALPALRSLERLRTLETWLDARAADALDSASLHDLLTAVVEETHAACDEIAFELLGAPPPQKPPVPEKAAPGAPEKAAPAQGQSQSQASIPAPAKVRSE